MKHLYYINGKRVSGNEYYGSIYSEHVRDYMIRCCIEYYKKHHKEFNDIARFANDEILFSILYDKWERTEDYKISMQKAESSGKGCIFLALCGPFIMSVILLIWYIISES